MTRQRHPASHLLLRTARIFAPVALALASSFAFADTVYLTNGNVLEGKVRYEKGKVIIQQAAGTITVDASRVSHVEPKKTNLDEYEERSAELARKENPTGDDYAALGRFASDNGLRRQSESAYQKAIELDPNQKAARLALGFVLFNEHWMTPDEANEARGMVKHNGAWVTPEAKADLLRLESQEATKRALAEAEANKLELERLKLERLDRELELVEAERARIRDDDYYRYRQPVQYVPIPIYVPPPPVVRPIKKNPPTYKLPDPLRPPGFVPADTNPTQLNPTRPTTTQEPRPNIPTRPTEPNRPSRPRPTNGPTTVSRDIDPFTGEPYIK